MSVELVLEACRLTPEDTELTAETLNDLSAVYALAQHGKPARHGGSLPHAVTLLTAALGQLPRFNPTHLLFGFGGPHLKSRQWVDLDRIQLIMTQIIGMCQLNWDVQRVNVEAQYAVSDAVTFGLIEKKDYDGWVPGMTPGSGRRTAVSATPYGLARAHQAAAQAATTPPSSEYPWRKAAPSPAPGQAPAPSDQGAAPAQGDEPGMVETGTNIEPLSSPPPAMDIALGQPKVSGGPRERPSPGEDRYAWARQVELVKATNQVVGEGELNPGVLSKACKNGEITTNQKTGRGSMVEVKSFLAWLGRKRELTREELDQVRNAIIGEIHYRV